jgi:thioesterase domain-containing protein
VAPTIERVAALVREKIGAPAPGAAGNAATHAEPARETAQPRARYLHLVPMHPGADRERPGDRRSPFFLVAGMFGNVLNLRHLAHLVGADRRFFGLQARGLYGDSAPHETFEEMARAYLAEMRSVQPHGPYAIGGFSGGGITAYEMAQQLVREGEEVALLVLLDTPLPHRPALSAKDRARIQWLELKSKGPAYFAEWAERRAKWEAQRLRRLFEEPEPDRRSDEFRSEAIGHAFLEALPRYVLRPYEGKVLLFRPRPSPAWIVDGRFVDRERHYVLPDNGWTPWAPGLEVHEVPGDHDSMVLEPNVRVLARRLRTALDTIERNARRTPRPGALERDDPSGTRSSRPPADAPQPAQVSLEAE